jgi:hypothetical protein
MIGLYKNEKFLTAVYKSNNISSEEFKGDVLYVGMGAAHLYGKHTEDVTSTTFIELDSEIIAENILPDCIIIEGDAYDANVEGLFDVIVLDIWDKAVYKKEVMELVEKYKPFLKEGGEIKHLTTIYKRRKGKVV